MKGSRTARDKFLEPVGLQRRLDQVRLAGFNFSIFLALGAMPYGQHFFATVSGSCKPNPEDMQVKEYCQQSEYCFMSLSAKSWQYRDRRKPEVGTILYSYRMTSRVLYYAQYHRQHCTLHSFEQLGALYICTTSMTHI